MSTSHKEGIIALQDFESQVRGRHIPTRRKYDINSVNTISDVYVLWCGVAWDTLPSSLEYSQRKGVIQKWLNLLFVVPFEEVLSACKELAAALVERQWSSYDAFKRHHRQSIPFVGDIMSPCKWYAEGAVRLSDPQSFCKVRSLLLFPLRINLRCKEMEAESVEHFCSTQEKVSSWSANNVHKGRELESTISRWYSKVFPTLDARCHHGPGRTSELERKDACISKKYAEFHRDQLLDYCGISELLSCDPGLLRQSKLICVPKDFSKYRTICAEPAVLQFCQQGVARHLVDGMGNSSLSSHVTLKDQTPNQFLACIGSIDGSFATIDLSDASDTVAWTLVRDSFSRTPCLRYLYACRSYRVELPDGRVLPISAFATMGSALTFPVESITFAAIVEKAFDLFNVPRPRRKYRVYGDDIVVPEAIFDCVMELLSGYGFSVNTKKTFHGSSRFRESCGGEYLDGYDVTPFRIGRRFSHVTCKNRPSQYEERISLINQMFSFGYSTVRSFVLSQVRATFGEPLFSDDPSRSDCVYSPWATNFQAPHRFNSQLQRGEVLSMALMPGKQLPRDEVFESWRLYEWLRVKENGGSDDDVQCDIDTLIAKSQALCYDKPSPPTLRRVWR